MPICSNVLEYNNETPDETIKRLNRQAAERWTARSQPEPVEPSPVNSLENELLSHLELKDQYGRTIKLEKKHIYFVIFGFLFFLFIVFDSIFFKIIILFIAIRLAKQTKELGYFRKNSSS